MKLPRAANRFAALFLLSSRLPCGSFFLYCSISIGTSAGITILATTASPRQASRPRTRAEAVQAGLVALGALVITVLISTYWVPGPLVLWDLPWEAITGAILWVYLWFNQGKLGKKGGIYLILLYIVYVTLRSVFFAVD